LIEPRVAGPPAKNRNWGTWPQPKYLEIGSLALRNIELDRREEFTKARKWPMDNEQKDVKTRLGEWINREGFPYEMRVARAFQKAGFWVTQSDYYDDPETKTRREIDVVAMFHRSFNGVVLRVEFVIECKSSKDKPWLLFCEEQERLESPAWVANRCASNMGMQVLHELSQEKDLQKLALFRLRPPIGYGLKQAFNNENRDLAYTAMCSVGNAAKARSIYWREYPNESAIIEFIFPVIAIDGQLFECHLNDKEDVEISETPSATLLWRNPITSVIHTQIDVQTSSSIDHFAVESFRAAKELITEKSNLILAAREKRVRKRSRRLLE
jgi:hypothetical protein